jgi:hypothetical protein
MLHVKELPLENVLKMRTSREKGHNAIFVILRPLRF